MLVEGLVAEVTAQFLGTNIVVSPLNNISNPWLDISGREGADSHPPILLVVYLFVVVNHCHTEKAISFVQGGPK